jgi:hypothetical protein
VAFSLCSDISNDKNISVSAANTTISVPCDVSNDNSMSVSAAKSAMTTALASVLPTQQSLYGVI